MDFIFIKSGVASRKLMFRLPSDFTGYFSRCYGRFPAIGLLQIVMFKRTVCSAFRCGYAICSMQHNGAGIPAKSTPCQHKIPYWFGRQANGCITAIISALIFMIRESGLLAACSLHYRMYPHSMYLPRQRNIFHLPFSCYCLILYSIRRQKQQDETRLSVA